MKDSNRDLQQITRLDKLFHPKSITIVGVSSASTALGGSSFLRRLLDAGYDGRIYPINPKSDEIQGLKTYPDIRSLPEIPPLSP